MTMTGCLSIAGQLLKNSSRTAWNNMTIGQPQGNNHRTAPQAAETTAGGKSLDLTPYITIEKGKRTGYNKIHCMAGHVQKPGLPFAGTPAA